MYYDISWEITSFFPNNFPLRTTLYVDTGEEEDQAFCIFGG